ncbi:SDR family oxidoreductase [Amycolatopsis australiensis]|uniref:3-oxoacyl-[acyl-carrier protein] reductase n=1 Tax=Amycolatopsis australiensis TaxID=546364 RepID=A0A1K1SQY1_9PSEU|nr:SDR family oxidoreductase [Amycolatopsis australiensis]SFW86721.1 3-oxoacyl-[acyl-carrier protein] reductase [Amycolatopsis australiensis]
MSNSFDGRTAVVTGASRGIGLAIAERLVAAGARVVITARRKAELDEAVARLGGPEVALGVAGKADDTGHQDETVRLAVERFGGLDMLVNNAGINPWYGPMVELDLVLARKIVEVNCLAALSWVQRAHHAWLREHGGAVVNVASHSAIKPEPGVGFYGASKAMLVAITKLLAVELGPRIRVNAVAPAVVKTRFSAALYEGREEQVAAAYPLKRLGEPEDIGSAVAFLLSGDAALITGELLVVDGGVTLGGAAR